MAKKSIFINSLIKYSGAMIAAGILLPITIANAEDLPFKDGLYVTDQKYCSFTEAQKSALGDAAGIHFRTLGNGKIDYNYETVCGIKDVRENGNKVAFKTVCSSEGETDEYDNLFTMLSKTSYETEGTAYSICEPSFVSQLSVEQITNVQTILVTLGFEPGTPDGKIGPNTNRAINAFRKQNGLPLTLELDQNTFDLLMKAG